MKPSARFRTLPRSASLKRANACPSTNTSPAVGSSRPPSKWSSVLLPDPEAPTIATVSPAATSRSMPSSTGTSSGPVRYVLRRSRQPSTRFASFIAQRFGGVDAYGSPRGIDRRDERERERDDGDHDDVGRLHLRRQLADVVDALVEELDAQRALDRRHDDVDVERERKPAGDADHRPDDADQ